MDREPADDSDAPPRHWRIAAMATLGAVLAGALYIVWLRGEAITVDLATLAGKVWCF